MKTINKPADEIACATLRLRFGSAIAVCCAALLLMPGCGNTGSSAPGASPSQASSEDDGITEEVSQTVPIVPGSKIVIDNDLGDISVSRSDLGNATVQITADKTADSSADLPKLTIEVDKEPDVVRISLRHPTPNVEGLTADLEVAVPQNAAVTGTTVDGDISAAGLAGPVAALSNTGDITLSGCSGPVTVKTASGEAQIKGGESPQVFSKDGDITLSGVSGQTAINTSSGQVTLNQSQGMLTFTSLDGDIGITGFDGPISGKTISGDVTITGGSGDVNVGTQSSDIKIDGGSHAAVSANSGSGDVQLGGALASFSASTGGGDITVNSATALAGAGSAKTSSGDIGISLPRSTTSLTVTARAASGNIADSVPSAVATTTAHEVTLRIGSGAQAHLTLVSDKGNVSVSEP